MTVSQTDLALDKLAPGTISHFYIDLVSDAFGRPIGLPIMVAKGKSKGRVLGLTAALHGNELNGIKAIHRLFSLLTPRLDEFKGTLVAVPGVNVPGIHAHQRNFVDGIDLNRVMPGRARGNASDVFTARFVKHVVSRFDYLVDLHTASFGRINSYYVRADLEDKHTYRMALSQYPQIILHNKGRDGSLRGAAAKIGIPAITVELGNPQLFQLELVEQSLLGLQNLMSELKMISFAPTKKPDKPIICQKSQWIYTDEGGLLEVLPKVCQRVKKSEVIATLANAFGEVIRTYVAPHDGIVIGKSSNPAGQTGARIIHLGTD